MKISNNWMECDVIPRPLTGRDITLRVSDDAPEEVKKWAEDIRKNIAEGKYDHDLNALYDAMIFRASRVGI